MFADRRKGEKKKTNGDKISEAAKQRINANNFACTLHIDMHNHHTNIFAKLDTVARANTAEKKASTL